MTPRDDRSVVIAEPHTPADIVAVADLFRAYAASLDVDLAYQNFADEVAGLPGKYATPEGALLLARSRSGGEPVGCVALRAMQPAGCCEMKRLFIVPEARGAGLGRQLVEALIVTATARGYREIRLDTLPAMTGAQTLYARLGFAPIAPYYDTPVTGTVFLALKLEP